jgi:flagellar biosynthesis protein FlhB
LADGDRTEQPTQRRKEEARKKGQVARSVEVNSALILLCTFLFLKWGYTVAWDEGTLHDPADFQCGGAGLGGWCC